MCNSATPATPMLHIGPYHGPWPNSIRALSHRDYRRFWSAQLISLTGTFMQQTAQQWLVYRLTGSALQLSIVGFATMLPLLLFSPLAGVVVDRTSKLRVVTYAQIAFMVLAAILAILTISGVVQYWHIVVLALLLGLATTLENPARQTLMIELVGRTDLTNAIALHASVWNVARFIGPAVAGILVARLGEGTAFAINALTFLPVILALFAIRLTPRLQPRSRSSPLSQMKEGFQYVLQDRYVVVLMAMAFSISFLAIPYTVLLPIFAGDILGLGAEGFGLLFSAAGVGAVLGGALLAVLGNMRRPALFIGSAMLVYASSLLVFSRSHSLALSLVMLALTGAAQLSQLATTNSILQIRAPDVLRGRVISVFLWVHGGAIPLGSLMLGVLAEHWGPRNALTVSAIACGLVALSLSWQLNRSEAMEID